MPCAVKGLPSILISRLTSFVPTENHVVALRAGAILKIYCIYIYIVETVNQSDAANGQK